MKAGAAARKLAPAKDFFGDMTISCRRLKAFRLGSRDDSAMKRRARLWQADTRRCYLLPKQPQRPPRHPNSVIASEKQCRRSPRPSVSIR